MPQHTRRTFLKGAVAAGALAWSGAARSESSGRPNLLLITTDQLHWRAFGAAGPFFETPAMDALARSGMIFQSAFCTTPQCSPSRSSLYTGRYPHKTTVIGNLDSTTHLGTPQGPLPASAETLGSRLRAAGYNTAYFGKWHLGNHEAFSKHFDRANFDGDSHAGATDQAGAYLAERARDAGRPFCCCVNYINPHDIYEAGGLAKTGKFSAPAFPVPHPASWRETFEGKPAVQKRYAEEDQGKCLWGKPDSYWEMYRAVYREKVRLADAEIGRLLKRLDETGLAERTIVALTADHGDMDTNHRLIFKGPFMYENLVRVPLMIRVPGAWGGTPGASGELVTLCDVLPTFCDFAGADAGDVDGVTLRPVLTGKALPQPRDYVVSQYYGKQRWVNPIRMIRTREFKYNRYIDHGEEFYDLVNDPDELKNLARDPKFAEKKEALAAELRAWMTKHGDTAFETYWPTNRDGSRFQDKEVT